MAKGASVKNSPEYLAVIDNFKTISKKTEGQLLPPNYGSDAKNLRFDDTLGTITKRLSRAKYASMSTLGALPVMSVFRYYKNSNNTKYQIAAYDTFLKVGNDSIGSFSNIATGLTANSRWSWITYKNLCYGFNGTDANQVYDGVHNCQTMGVPIPSAPSAADSGNGGNVTGAISYVVTYEIDGYQEGSSSAASSPITVTNKQVTVTIPTSANPRVTSRNIYRTKSGGSVFYYLNNVANNTDVSYTDNTLDASLDINNIAPIDYDGPGSYKLACLHNSRIFLANNSTYQSRVAWSDINAGGFSTPDVFPVESYYDILKDNGEVVTFIGEDNYGQLIIMKPSAIIRVNTDNDDETGWYGGNTVLSPLGCVAPYSAVKTTVGIIYIARYGESKKRLMLWDGSQTTSMFEELEPVISAILDTRLNDCIGWFANSKYYLAYNDISTGETFNNRVLIVDLISQTWTIDYKNVNCFCSWNSGDDWGELISGTSDATGFLHREDTLLNDLSITLKSQIDLGTFDTCCESGGTEDSPVIVMTGTGLSTQRGNTLVSALTGIVSSYNDPSLNQSISPSSSYISPVLEVSAKNLLKSFSNAVLGIGGYANVYIKTGDTIVACQADTWHGPFIDSSDISSVTPAKYLQYLAKLYVMNPANYAGTYFDTSTYLFKFTFGYGVIVENDIELIYTSNWIDFNWLDSSLKRLRKRIRSVKIEFDRNDSSGTLTFGYLLDGSVTRVDVNFDLSVYASKGYCIYQFPLSIFCTTLQYRLYNDDINPITIKKITFDISPEPFYPLS